MRTSLVKTVSPTGRKTRWHGPFPGGGWSTCAAVSLVEAGRTPQFVRKSVPPSVSANIPDRSFSCGEAPFTWPNSSASRSWFPEWQAQLIDWKGRSFRGLALWDGFANISLPVPLSPCNRTETSRKCSPLSPAHCLTNGLAVPDDFLEPLDFLGTLGRKVRKGDAPGRGSGPARCPQRGEWASSPLGFPSVGLEELGRIPAVRQDRTQTTAMAGVPGLRRMHKSRSPRPRGC